MTIQPQRRPPTGSRSVRSGGGVGRMGGASMGSALGAWGSVGRPATGVGNPFELGEEAVAIVGREDLEDF
jgi:hypothetical protein